MVRISISSCLVDHTVRHIFCFIYFWVVCRCRTPVQSNVGWTCVFVFVLALSHGSIIFIDVFVRSIDQRLRWMMLTDVWPKQHGFSLELIHESYEKIVGAIWGKTLTFLLLTKLWSVTSLIKKQHMFEPLEFYFFHNFAELSSCMLNQEFFETSANSSVIDN